MVNVLPDKTVPYVLRRDGWRIVLGFLIMVLPFYAWILFYYLSTGAYEQPVEIVATYSPLLATFVIPLVVATWVLGFKGWRVFVVAVVAALISSWLPSGIAGELLPGSYIRLAIVLIVLRIGVSAFHYWRAYHILKLPVARYTPAVGYMTGGVVLLCLIALLPISI